MSKRYNARGPFLDWVILKDHCHGQSKAAVRIHGKLKYGGGVVKPTNGNRGHWTTTRPSWISGSLSSHAMGMVWLETDE